MLTRRARALAISLALMAQPVAAEDWTQLGAEAAEVLTELIHIDTQNPPGGEIAAAEVLARRLRADGIAAEVFESAPGRGNVHARLKGGGAARPIVLLSHLDVVPADPRGWRVAPFAGVREDGYVYGRGALDAKGVAAIQLLAVLALQRNGAPLARDVILLATADEETGGRAGAGWIAEHRPELVAGAEYLLTEGDHIHLRGGSRPVIQVAVAEKTPCWVRLTAHGESGHGSTPPAETAVTRLLGALDRLDRYRAPVRVSEPVERYFAALAALEPQGPRGKLAHVGSSLRDPSFLAEFTKNPLQNALVRNTITPTVLRAGIKTNVIPGEAAAELDCRLLPGEKPADFLVVLRRLVADDTIELETLLSFPASSSSTNSDLMTAVRDVVATEFGGAAVVPSVIPGFTDSHYFRELGIASYGFVPFILADDEAKTVHGTNERVSEENLRDGVRRLVGLLRALPSSAAR